MAHWEHLETLQQGRWLQRQQQVMGQAQVQALLLVLELGSARLPALAVPKLLLLLVVLVVLLALAGWTEQAQAMTQQGRPVYGRQC